MAKSDKITVERFDSLDALLELGSEYEDFVAGAPDIGALFYSSGWLRRIAPEFEHPRKKVCFLIARRNGRLAGFAPLSIEQRSWDRVRRLYFYGDYDSALYNGEPCFVVPNENDVEPCIQTFLHYVVEEMHDEWDQLDLTCFPIESIQLWIALTTVPEAQARPDDMVGHLADLRGGYEAFYAQVLSRGLKKDLRRRRRRLEESGVKFRFGSTDRLSSRQLSRVADIYRARQAALHARGVQRDPIFAEGTEATLQILLDYAADRGCARHYYAEVDGHIAACELCFAHQGTLYEYVAAFDERYARFALPKLLHLYLYEREVSEFRTRWINMFRGTNRLKSEFAPIRIRYLNVEAVNTRHSMSKLKYVCLTGARKVHTLGLQLGKRLRTESLLGKAKWR